MLSAEDLAKYENDGYLLINNFLTLDECKGLKQECDRLIESNHFTDDLKQLPKDKRIINVGTDYFLTSNDKIRAFLEPNIELTEENARSKLLYNKIGHALHVLNPVFKEATYNEKAKNIMRSLNFIKPVVCQSMYIFKQPFIGHEVKPHQDATYLFPESDPNKLIGIWIALEDANPGNGCLEFIPGSHKSGVLDRRFIRNPNKEEFDAGNCLIYKGEITFKDEDFIPVAVPAGSCLLIHGLVKHRSKTNQSPISRHAYTFHVYDSASVKYSKENWLQENPTSFVEMY